MRGPTKTTVIKNYFEAFDMRNPHLKVIIIENGLSSNGPYIRDFELLNLRFTFETKLNDHIFHFAQMDEVPGNKSYSDLLVNRIENYHTDKD